MSAPTAPAMSIATRSELNYGKQLAHDILSKIDPEDCPKPSGNNILLCIYQRSKVKDLGGGKAFHFADQTVKEDIFQGTVGLVLAVGPDAYKSDRNRTFWEPWCQRGDWVLYPLYESQPRRIMFNGLALCMMQDTDVVGTTEDPRSIG